MRDIVKKTHRLFLQNKKTVAVAESCTGGKASSCLTRNPGSSRYFMLGIVAYSNKSKSKMLKIPLSLIKKEGAVSKIVACLMAKSIRKIAGTDIGLGITGIAGPAGGTLKKPVGTVYIALNCKFKAVCKKFILKGSREEIRKQSCEKALELLSTAFEK